MEIGGFLSGKPPIDFPAMLDICRLNANFAPDAAEAGLVLPCPARL